MAGVGFELKKLFRSEKGYFKSIRAYTVSAVVTEGPMLLNILLLFLLRTLMQVYGATVKELDIFLYTLTYITMFSLIFSNSVLMFIDRYVSDCIYKNELHRILPAFYGLLFWLCVPGGLLALIYLGLLPVSGMYRVISLLGFCIMMIIWSEVSFLSAVKQYTKVLIGFAAALIVAVLAAMGILHFTALPRILAALAAAILGYFVMMVMFLQQIMSYFPGNGTFNLFEFFPALDKYRILIPIGFFMAIGLYAHNFVVWSSPFRNEIWRYGVFCTKYDVPAFFATLTIMPLLVRFVVSVETNFYHQYREYFDAILHGGTLEDIRIARKKMTTTMFREMDQMLEIQFFVTVICATFLGNYLNKVGIDEEQTSIFRVLCFGYCMYGMAKCMLLMMLYFEDRLGALIGAAWFALTSAAFTWISIQFAPSYWGCGFLVAAFTTVLYGAFRLRYFVNRLEYKVFLTQPLFYSDEKGFFERLAISAQRLEEKLRARMTGVRRKKKRKKSYEK